MESPETPPPENVIVSFPSHLAAEPIRIQRGEDDVHLSQEAGNLVRSIARRTGVDEILVIERILIHFGRVILEEDPTSAERIVVDPRDA